ncbi:4Fe-4S binding protein [Georgfuchsia toluolica]|uniref:4Fe-4S binding protein n=1 Tax=Georgfuchsia toluolica TaxID=424218 RepID=UPI001FE741C2|nr:4Fe-4S binding protein [Georgfuchsia toluolica]
MENTHSLKFVPPIRHHGRNRLARLGDWMGHNRRILLAIQWVIVIFYVVLVALPASLPLPQPESRLFSGEVGTAASIDPSQSPTSGAPVLQEKAPTLVPWHDKLVLFAQFAFWGIWWPFVIASMLLMGRVWCGVLCPEGALTEFASRHGRGGRIPRWVRWSGWPVAAFAMTTVYGQLVSVYEYPKAVLVILGGSTVAAVAVGYLYGRGKRVWCRYLCPVSGVFALLARLAPVHFRVDRERWNAHPARTAAVDCAPLLDVKHLQGASQCHACGRCSGHHDAVALEARSPNAEILAAKPATPEALLLIFGTLGVAIGAFQWTVSPWFVQLKQAAAAWLIERDMLWPLDDSAPWWLLTHYPEAGDVFTWLDGTAILAYIGAVTLALGGGIWLLVVLAAWLARRDWRSLALGLTPLAGIGLFLGLSMMTVTHLRAEGVPLGWVGMTRDMLLLAGVAWSAWLGVRLAAAGKTGATRRALGAAVYLAAVAAIAATWILIFHVW